MTTSPDGLVGLDDDGGGSDDLTGRDAAHDREAAELRRQLRAERERSLNATDRVLGAQAEAAQARAQIKELEYVLHVREAELDRLKELLDQAPESGLPASMRRLAAAAQRRAPSLATLRPRRWVGRR